MNQHERIVLAGAVRTPVGRLNGVFKEVPAVRLQVLCFEESLVRTGLEFEKGKISEVITGNVYQSPDSVNIARVSALLAGIPVNVPAFTVQRNFASGLQAISSAVQAIRAGDGRLFLIGGAENMSRAPILVNNARQENRLQNFHYTDGLWESLTDPVTGKITGRASGNLAEKYDISREEQRAFARQSYLKAQKATQERLFLDQIVPVSIRTDDTPDGSGSFNPVERFIDSDEIVEPGLEETIAGGDGAASMLVMPESKAVKLGIDPEAYIVSYAYSGSDPAAMGEGPVVASRSALKKAGLTTLDLDYAEIHESFAAQAIHCQRALEIPENRLNVWGGAIALGHPAGAAGTILTVKMIHILSHMKSRYGLVTMCVGGGQGAALIIERI